MAAVAVGYHRIYPDEMYKQCIGNKLFGFSRRAFAVKEDACVECIKSVLSDVVWPGMRNYVPQLRAEAASLLVVEDTHDIPRMSEWPTPCPVDTQGFAQTRLSPSTCVVCLSLRPDFFCSEVVAGW